MAGDAIYLEIIPTMTGFATRLAKESSAAAYLAGTNAGKVWAGEFEKSQGNGPASLSRMFEGLGASSKSAADQAKSSFSTAADAVGTMAGEVVKATGATDLLKDGWSQALDLDAGVAKITAALDLTEAQSAKAGDVAGRLYSQALGKSMEDVTGAVSTVMSSIDGMADASATEVEAVSAAALNLAKAFDQDVSTSARNAGALVKNGLAADATEAFDLMTAGLQKVPAALRGDVMTATEQYAGSFRALGFSGEQAMGAIVSATDLGKSGVTTMGAAVGEFAKRAADLSNTGAQEALASMGLSGEELAGKLLAGGATAQGAMKTIVESLRSIDDPGQQAAAAIALFGSPLEELGRDNIPTFLDGLAEAGTVLGETSGKAAEMGDTLNDNLASSMEGAKRSFTTMISEALEPFLEPAQKVMDWLVETPGALAAFGAALAAIAAVWAIYTVQQWAANTAMFSSPWLWVAVAVAAVIAALVLLIANWDAVVAWLKDVWASIVEWLAGVWESIKLGVETAWNAIGEFFTGLWESIKLAIETAWNAVKEFFTGLWESIKLGVETAWNAIGEFFAGLWTSIRLGVETAWNAVKEFFTGLWMSIISGITEKWSEVVAFLAGLWVTIKDNLTVAWNAVKEFFTGLWTSITGAIQTAWNGVKTFFSGLWDAIKNTVTEKWNAIVEWVKGIPEKFMSAIAGISELGAKIGEFVQNAKDAVVERFTSLVDWVKEIPSKITGALGDLGNLLKTAGTRIISGLFSGLTAKWEEVKGWFSGIGDWIADHKGPKSYDLGLLVPNGRWIMEGLGDGLVAGLPELEKTTAKIAHRVSLAAAPTVRTGSIASKSHNDSGAGMTLVYHAAENRSVTSEEELMGLLGRAAARSWTP